MNRPEKAAQPCHHAILYTLNDFLAALKKKTKAQYKRDLSSRLTCVLGKSSGNGDIECFARWLEYREVGITSREGQSTCPSSTPPFLLHRHRDTERFNRKNRLSRKHVLNQLWQEPLEDITFVVQHTH